MGRIQIYLRADLPLGAARKETQTALAVCFLAALPGGEPLSRTQRRHPLRPLANSALEPRSSRTESGFLFVRACALPPVVTAMPKDRSTHR
jgi:hypothetical protein